jgi:DNA (cytosine-5)-methyltransferase 1
MTYVTLFAGPGGSCLGAHANGIQPLGIEWDDHACATRRAAGLPTLQADIAKLDPLDFAPLTGLIGTPPCQAFSMAGKGAGRGYVGEIVQCLRDIAEGHDTRDALTTAQCSSWSRSDGRSRSVPAGSRLSRSRPSW